MPTTAQVATNRAQLAPVGARTVRLTTLPILTPAARTRSARPGGRVDIPAGGSASPPTARSRESGRLAPNVIVEERILALQDRKRRLAQAALGEAAEAHRLTRDDLLALLE